jgi:ATP-binding cassette subfamily B protein
MIGIAVVGFVGRRQYRLWGPRGPGFGADLRQDLFSACNRSLSQSRPPGHRPPVTRLTNDVTLVQEALMMTLRMLVRVPLLMVGSNHHGRHHQPQPGRC